MRFLNATPSAVQTNVGLLLIRLVLGTIFIAHGAQKVFTFGMSGVGDGFVQMGIPLGGALGPIVSLVELVGGVAIILGLFTRAAGFGIAAVMLGAIVYAHLPAGFFAPNGYEFALMLLAAAGALVVMGAGAYSADAVLGQRLSGGARPSAPVRAATAAADVAARSGRANAA
jgi:putative oxidoreductase